MEEENFEHIEDFQPEESPLKPKRGHSKERMFSLSKESKLTTIERRKLVERIESLILKGESRSSILKTITQEFGIEDTYYIQNYYMEGRRNILKLVSTSIEDIKNAHVILYEKIYKYFDEVDYSFGKAKALAYKEKLLGLHKEENFIEINNENNIELELSEEDLYDVKVLSYQEFNRFKYLKLKMEGNTSESKSAIAYRKKKKRDKKLYTLQQKELKKAQRKLERENRKRDKGL